MGPEVIAGAMILSTAVSAFGAIQQGGQMSAMADYNRRVAENDAQMARAAADSEANDIRLHGERVQSGVRATTGALGLLAEGSPYEVLLNNAAEIELDAQRRLFRGEVEASRHKSQAQLESYRGSTAVSNSYLQAGATLLEGGAKAYRVLSSPKPGTTPSGGTWNSPFGGPTADRWD